MTLQGKIGEARSQTDSRKVIGISIEGIRQNRQLSTHDYVIALIFYSRPSVDQHDRSVYPLRSRRTNHHGRTGCVQRDRLDYHVSKALRAEAVGVLQPRV